MTSSGQLLSRKQKLKQAEKKRASAEPGGKAKKRKLPQPSESFDSSSDNFEESSQYGGSSQGDAESEANESEDEEGGEREKSDESEDNNSEKEEKVDTEEQREAKRQALLASRKGLPVEIVRLMRGQINRMAESNVLGVARELVKVSPPNASCTQPTAARTSAKRSVASLSPNATHQTVLSS